ncbi:MAG: aminopeptidase P family protein [Gemmatimonadetes bacterium]|nr:aminopeptidase P family protein [Gemmatimonadota bacterium]
MLNPSSVASLQAALRDAGVDGWLLYDFRGINAIASGLVGIKGFVSRRWFVWVPVQGTPVAITHVIEQNPWHAWPAAWENRQYSAWPVLEAEVARCVKGKRIVMEYSPGDAVPYVDYVPAGVLEMVRAAGATVASSGDLVTRFLAVWNDDERRSHAIAAEQLKDIAYAAFKKAGAAARAGAPITEYELTEWIRGEFNRLGLWTDHGPNVSATENAANPHYDPSPDAPRHLKVGDIVLIDLWAKATDGMWADQTYMASIGEPSAKAVEVWNAVRDARDAAIALLRTKLASGAAVRGGEADDASRAVIEARGYGKYFTHRTGHSIDASGLHGSGAHLDNLETREERVLLNGSGFSIEPGIYIAGEIGMRTEVNAYVHGKELVVTPAEPQKDLVIV